MKPAARAELLRRHTVAEIAEIHEALVGEAKPKTPRPILEKRILHALASGSPQPAHLDQDMNILVGEHHAAIAADARKRDAPAESKPLNLAHGEEVIAQPPKIDLLPTDDSTPVLPPTEEQFQARLTACESYLDVAPRLRDVVEFTAETGLRRAEVFHLTCGSLDVARAAIRVEMQVKSRMVNGRPWKPKHNKWREVPLSAKAKAIVERRVAERPGPDEQLFPNRGGSPYERMDGAPEGAGKSWFGDAVADAGLKGKVTFHGLRHLFAVRLLTRGVPITVVSELLGHTDVNLTVKRYGRFASDAKVKWDAVRVLDD